MIETKQVEIAKEADDVLVLLVNIVKAAKAGKSASEIGATELPDFLAAIQGIEQIKDEASHKEAIMRTIGIRIGEVGAALLA